MKPTPTEILRRDAVEAARRGDTAAVERNLSAAEQQDRAMRLVMYVLAGLAVASMVANVVLVAFVLQQSFSVNASQNGVGVTVGEGR